MAKKLKQGQQLLVLNGKEKVVTIYDVIKTRNIKVSKAVGTRKSNVTTIQILKYRIKKGNKYAVWIGFGSSYYNTLAQATKRFKEGEATYLKARKRNLGY